MNVNTDMSVDIYEILKSKNKERSERNDAFSKLLEEMHAQATANMLREKQKADEKAAERAKEEKKEKINELMLEIARLRHKLSMLGGDDPGVMAQISMLQSELTLMLLSM